MKKKIFIIILSIFLLFLNAQVSAVLAAELIIVANRNIKQNEISKDEIKFIYLGRKKKWDDDSRITFVVLRSKLYQEEFMTNFLGKTPEQFDHYWKQNVFTGNGQTPITFENIKDLVDFIANRDGSVGYVPEDANIGNLKILKIK
ncbi:hypothetical protein [Desulforegula conservatrix]|uniref:hypothetical protein n=1 Tax=Desulforegula conservatrix TaxID=153026 RepID=UPI0004083F8B|nr:hypothetical protein [Desulforegula conservatrix]